MNGIWQRRGVGEGSFIAWRGVELHGIMNGWVELACVVAWHGVEVGVMIMNMNMGHG